MTKVDSADFRRWQRDDPDTPGRAARKIERVLKMRADEIRELKQRVGL